MEYRGLVKDGVVVFEAEAPPEGAAVRVELVNTVIPSSTSSSAPSLWEKLKKYSGAVGGLPRDMARNHDHYIHGGPKK
jgi:hypothetical protein